MPTVEAVANSVLAALDADFNIDLVVQWINERYAQLASRYRLRHLRRDGEIVVPALISAQVYPKTGDRTVGTIDPNNVPLGLVNVDTIAALKAASPLDGWFLRVTTIWYEVERLVDDGSAPPTILLRSPFTEADAFDGGFYQPMGATLVKRYYDLPLGTRWIGDFVYGRRHLRLTVRPMTELDSLVPSRVPTESGPYVLADAGLNPTTGRKRLELYPYATRDELLSFKYWASPEPLQIGQPIPDVFDYQILKEGALVDAMRRMYSQSASSGRIDMAGFWRNEMRAQETKWDKCMREARFQAETEPDASIYLRSRFADFAEHDITNAYEEWIARGNGGI